jgi:hypothetical protein
MAELKKPQDRQAKATPDEKPAGWDLLKPFSEVPAWDQADLIEAFKPLMAAGGSESVNLLDLDMRAVGSVARLVHERFAVDPAALQAFTSGPGGLERMLQLASAYLEQLGE